MKKTLLSVLAGLMIVGSATALPGPEDRKKACEQNPEKVWVEKTTACVDENPCRSDNEHMARAYCFPIEHADVWYAEMSFPSERNRDKVIDNYVQTILGTSVTERVELGDTGRVFYMGTKGYDEHAIGVKTADGGYFAMIYVIRSDLFLNDVLQTAAKAFGRFGYNDEAVDDGNTIQFAVEKMDEQLCRDIINFAVTLLDDSAFSYADFSFKKYDADNYRCVVSVMRE